MTVTNPKTHREEFNELDPHGFELPGHGQHAHHIAVGPFTLRTVLLFLLMFTALTVGAAQAEVWIMHTLDIELPWWVNVVGAMAIAVVKSVLVMGYFMQLKYDNPMNSILMCFCFFALGLFLFFTGLDLFSRGAVYDYKAPQVVAGGTGNQVTQAGGKPMVTAARERWMTEWGPEKFALVHAEVMSHGHAAVHEHAPVVSSENRSRPLTDAPPAHGEPAPHTPLSLIHI
mgnify:CR=1 FL=1